MGLISRLFKDKENVREQDNILIGNNNSSEEIIDNKEDGKSENHIEEIDYSKEFDIDKEYIVKKELSLEDGSIIQKGTCFRVDGVDGKEYDVHFEMKEGNKYNNDLGDGYKFSLNTLKNISEVNNEYISREGVLEQINNDLDLEEKKFIEEHYKDYGKFTDKYIEDMNNYRIHELQEGNNIVDPIGIKEYIDHEIYSYEVEKKERGAEEELESDYDYWNENLYMGRLEENILNSSPRNTLEGILKSPLENKINTNMNKEYEME